jgi:HSP20 family molecular chaperone IbpA
MVGEIRKCPGIPVVTVESSEERHQEIILTTITKRAQQIFEERECKPGFELDDWLNAEKELWRDDDLNAPEFSLVLDSPKDSQATTILSLTARSLVVFRNRKRYTHEGNSGPDVQSVHLFPREINPALAEVQLVNGILRVFLPKKNCVSCR